MCAIPISHCLDALLCLCFVPVSQDPLEVTNVMRSFPRFCCISCYPVFPCILAPWLSLASAHSYGYTFVDIRISDRLVRLAMYRGSSIDVSFLIGRDAKSTYLLSVFPPRPRQNASGLASQLISAAPCAVERGYLGNWNEGFGTISRKECLGFPPITVNPRFRISRKAM